MLSVSAACISRRGTCPSLHSLRVQFKLDRLPPLIAAETRRQHLHRCHGTRAVRNIRNPVLRQESDSRNSWRRLFQYLTTPDMKMRRRVTDCDDSIDPKAREWPHLAVDVQDPKACLAQCRQRFVSEVVLTPDDDTPALCEALNRSAEVDEELEFGWLYCCSSVLCGVSFDRETRSAGQDRRFEALNGVELAID